MAIMKKKTIWRQNDCHTVTVDQEDINLKLGRGEKEVYRNKGVKRSVPRTGSTPRKFGWGCDPLPETLVLFSTKLCDFCCPIYYLTNNSISYLRSGPKISTWWYYSKEKVATCKRNLLSSRPECKNHTLLETKLAKIDPLPLTKTAKTIPFWATHTYIGHIMSSSGIIWL